MRRFLSVLILVSFPLTPFYVFAAEEAFAPFLGTWEYRQRNSASPTGYDAEGERIELKKQGGSIQGLYFGLQREGEHGLYYTLVEIKDIEVSEGGKISFRIPERDIYRERPRSLEEIQRVKRKSAGFTRVELEFQGQLKNGELVLRCIADPIECPEEVMAFRKGRWK